MDKTDKDSPKDVLGTARLCYDLENKKVFIDGCKSSTDLNLLTIYTNNDMKFMCVAPLNRDIITKGKENPNWIELNECFKERIAKYDKNESFNTKESIAEAYKRLAIIRRQQYLDATKQTSK